MINPTKPFKAVVPGSAYPRSFTTDDDLDPASIAARAAMDLGCLTEKDAKLVRAAQGQCDAKLNSDAGAKKSRGAAPENKASGKK